MRATQAVGMPRSSRHKTRESLPVRAGRRARRPWQRSSPGPGHAPGRPPRPSRLQGCRPPPTSHPKVEAPILNAALASRADNNDTIDLAVLGGLKNAQELNGYQVVHFQPFDPVHKRTEAAVKAADGRTFKVTKGAPQVILELSANAGQVKPAVEKAVNEFAARGCSPREKRL